MYVDAAANEMLMVVAFLLRRRVGKCSGSSGASVTTSTRVGEFRSARNVYTSRSSPHEVR